MQKARVITAFALAAAALIMCRRDTPVDTENKNRLPVYYKGYERVMTESGKTAYKPCRVDTMTDQSYIMLGYSKIDSHLTEITCYQNHELHGEFYSEDEDGSYCKGLYIHGKKHGDWIDYNAATDTTRITPYIMDVRQGIGCIVPLDMANDTLTVDKAKDIPTQSVYYWQDMEVTLDEFIQVTTGRRLKAPVQPDSLHL